ncbi:hypothetical protein [Roseovarius lutimaris]|uniref:hypothetical protein n=1 Tax=Roseovarius lutimaris TaxID=1005928 RepID=UPI0011601127|nr:hypothetical protein [Roseovarius lutimaris]
MEPTQLAYELSVKQLNLQREDLRNIRNQAAFAAAISGLIATVFSSMMGSENVSRLLVGDAFLGLNVESVLLFFTFGGSLAFAIRVQINWQKVTFDLNPLYILSSFDEGITAEAIQCTLAKDADRFFNENESVVDDAKFNLRMSLILSWSQIPAWLLLIY